MPRYDDDIRNAVKTIERYKREYIRREAEAEQCSDEQKRYSLLFGNWMISNRIGRYNKAAENQSKGIHESVFVVNGIDVCSCGLFDDAGDHFE